MPLEASKFIIQSFSKFFFLSKLLDCFESKYVLEDRITFDTDAIIIKFVAVSTATAMDVFLRAFRPSASQRRISEEHYELIQSEPTRPQIHIRHHYTHQINHHNHHRDPRRRILFFFLNFHKSCSLRRFLISLTALPFLAFIAILSSGIPPSYNDIRSFERRLPQHNLSLPFPEGKAGMYLRFPGHLWGHGLNNILQETSVPSHVPVQ